MNRRDFIIGAVGSPLATLLSESIIVAAPEWPPGSVNDESTYELWAKLIPELVADMREMFPDLGGGSR